MVRSLLKADWKVSGYTHPPSAPKFEISMYEQSVAKMVPDSAVHAVFMLSIG